MRSKYKVSMRYFGLGTLVLGMLGVLLVCTAVIAQTDERALSNQNRTIWKQLDLTTEQQTAIQSLERDSDAQLAAISSDRGLLSGGGPDSKLEAIKDNLNQSVLPLLNPAQADKFRQLTGRDYNGTFSGGSLRRPQTIPQSAKSPSKPNSNAREASEVHARSDANAVAPKSPSYAPRAQAVTLPIPRPVHATPRPAGTPYVAYPVGTPNPLGTVYVVKTPSPIVPYAVSTPRPVGTPRQVGTPRPVGTPRAIQPYNIGTPRPIGTPRAIGTPRPIKAPTIYKGL